MDKKKKSPKRALAIAALILIASIIIAMFVNIILDGDPGITLMFLFFIMIVPAVVYMFLWFHRILSGRGHDEASSEWPGSGEDAT